MGSSGWYYFAPYQENLHDVLSHVRDQVFTMGDYYHSLTWYRMYVNRAEFINLPLDQQRDARQKLKVLEAQGLPTTIEALVNNNAESGTHSILDIDHISSETEFKTVAPLPTDVLLELFGTIHPSHHLVEAQLDELQGMRYHWCGTYIIIYDMDQPTEVCFVGNSGD